MRYMANSPQLGKIISSWQFVQLLFIISLYYFTVHQIVEFRWSQGLRGPLHVPTADVEPYYKAYTLLAELMQSSDRVLKFRLLPGQVMSVDNRRALHGRTDFKTSGGARRLQVSQNIDVTFLENLHNSFLIREGLYPQFPLVIYPFIHVSYRDATLTMTNSRADFKHCVPYMDIKRQLSNLLFC